MAVFRWGPLTGAKAAIFDQYLALELITAGSLMVELGYSTKRPSLLIAGNGHQAPYISESCL